MDGLHTTSPFFPLPKHLALTSVSSDRNPSRGACRLYVSHCVLSALPATFRPHPRALRANRGGSALCWSARYAGFAGAQICLSHLNLPAADFYRTLAGTGPILRTSHELPP